MKRLAKKVIAVGAGKGGVGKSTVAVNLAVALAKRGLQVGLFDADLYGPSIPIMTGLRSLSPERVQLPEGKEQLLPFNKFGVKILSIGFFLDEALSFSYRGPVLHAVLQKMIDSVEWGELDLILIDLPPGTGDVLFSLKKLLEVDGAIVVTTPQTVALLDVIKAIHAFDQHQIPLLGVVENMAPFTTAGGERVALFGEGKGRELAEKLHVPFLGSIPLHQEISEGADCGIPASHHSRNREIVSLFDEMGNHVVHS